ncbi:alpha/beta fold hydrolase [Massilia putida]|uniref:alpha/beta fold hydrolase n=1 Tax=Massilia putida TaxID=1141883 RepID=UPI0009511A48|nr:hypothetical protein [Massilia putida]
MNTATPNRVTVKGMQIHVEEQGAGKPLVLLHGGIMATEAFGRTSPRCRRTQAGAIRARTMLVFADADAITPDHIAECYRALGGGQRDAGMDGSLRAAACLAVVPGTTHYDILGTTAVARLVEEFLKA